MSQLDLVLFQWLNSWAGVRPLWDTLIIFRAVYLWYIMMLGVMLFVAVSLIPRFRVFLKVNIELLFLALVSAFTARFLVAELIRFFYYRPRPYLVLENVRVLQHQLFGGMADNGSFPSGHASLAFAVATTVAFYYPKTSLLFFAAALSIGLGRVSAGVHWPSDILGGAILGIGTAWATHLVFNRFRQKNAA